MTQLHAVTQATRDSRLGRVETSDLVFKRGCETHLAASIILFLTKRVLYLQQTNAASPKAMSAMRGLMILLTLALHSLLVHDTNALKFTVADEMIGDIPVKRLVNTETQESISILPSQGGRVEEVKLKSTVNHKVIDVILSHNGNATAIKENAHFKGAILLPFANRIAGGKYVFQGKTYTLEQNEPDRHNALHGLLYKKSLDIIYSNGTDEYAIVILEYKFDGTDQGYPFPLKVIISYVLTVQGFLLNIDAFNDGESEPLPFYAGFHPYFKVDLTASAVLAFDRCSKYGHIAVNKTSLIPSGTTAVTDVFSKDQPIGGSPTNPTYFDDGYVTLQASALANCSQTVHTVYDAVTREFSLLFMEAQFRYIQVYTGSASSWGEQAIAVEPMSGETDAFNNHMGLTTLHAQERWRGSFGITLGETYDSSYHHYIIGLINSYVQKD